MPAGKPKSEYPGLHNVLRVTDKLLSGSSPEGDAGFESLKKLGVKTVLTVDGARPDLERARKFGMRYVHLPIGYNGIPENQGLRIARAVRDLPGRVYLHCHHGKHRGPAAAAVAKLCLDDRCTVADAIDFMKLAGTDKRYIGLFESVRTLKRPTQAELDKAPANFPETAEVSALALAMVEIDEHWEHLKLIRKAGWQVPPNHPDIVPQRVASVMAQHYSSTAKSAKRPELARWLTEAESNARELEKLLQNKKIAAATLEKSFQRMGMDCSRCHAKYRDAPAAK